VINREIILPMGAHFCGLSTCPPKCLCTCLVGTNVRCFEILQCARGCRRWSACSPSPIEEPTSSRWEKGHLLPQDGGDWTWMSCMRNQWSDRSQQRGTARWQLRHEYLQPGLAPCRREPGNSFLSSSLTHTASFRVRVSRCMCVCVCVCVFNRSIQTARLVCWGPSAFKKCTVKKQMASVDFRTKIKVFTFYRVLKLISEKITRFFDIVFSGKAETVVAVVWSALTISHL